MLCGSLWSLAIGSAHPMARLSKDQDTGGNSYVRRQVMELDAACLKSKRSKTAQHQAAAEAGQSAEPEAEPFSKPKPTRANIGPRQWMEAAAYRRISQQQPTRLMHLPSQAQCVLLQACMQEEEYCESVQQLLIASD